ncbi:MAG: phosphate ABC transporter substrate-binding protein PstS [Actinomycetes bacterium]
MIRSRTTTRRLALPAIVLTLAVGATACGGGSSDDGGRTTSTTAGERLAAATINGSGATFPQAFYETAIEAFKAEQPAVTVAYAGGGSGKGQTDLAAGLVDWAGSDSTVKPEDAAKFATPFLYFPTVAAPITMAYNLSGVKKLQLSADTIAGIFGGSITKWNDSAIEADNPKTDLPSTAIVVVHRADGSGTTANFTKYLTKAAPTTWTLGTDKVVNWPTGQQAGNGNAGIAQIVKSTAGAIGYVDFSDAEFSGLQYAAVKNRAGKYVAASLAGASAAVDGATINADLTYDPLDAAGPTAYPITAPTYLLVSTTYSDAAKGAAVKGFVEYILTGGQALAADTGFAKLPAELAARAIAQLKKVTVG